MAYIITMKDRIPIRIYTDTNILYGKVIFPFKLLMLSRSRTVDLCSRFLITCDVKNRKVINDKIHWFWYIYIIYIWYYQQYKSYIFYLFSVGHKKKELINKFE